MSLSVVRRRSVARLCLMVVLLSVQACGSGEHEGGYFPLTPGGQWQYRVERTTMDGTRQLRHALSVIEPAANQPADLRTRITLDGQRYIYRVSNDGIYRVGVQRKRGPRAADEGQPQMVMPAHPRIDQQWRGHSQTSLLESSAAPWETLFRVQVLLDMRYRIAALDAEITTPAGEFEHCVLIEGEGESQTDADLGNGVGQTRINVSTREWYAPGVGLVRMERNEQTSAQALRAGSLVMELDAWSQP